MNTKALYVINGALVLLASVGLLTYLLADRPASVALDSSTPAAPVRQKEAGTRATTPMGSNGMEPSERLLSNAEVERQGWSEAQLGSQQASEEAVVSVPLAALDPDAEMGLDTAQLATIQALRQAFNDAMRDAGERSSPQYREQWVAAQAQLDEYLQIYLGDEVYNKFSQKAIMARAAVEASGK